MSTPQVYRISPDEEINEVLRVVSQTEGDSLSLVLPDECVLFRNEINLRLLNSYAESANIRVAVVTRDAITRRQAAKYGVPVHAGADSPIAAGRSSSSPKADGSREGTDEVQDKDAVPRQPWFRRVAVLALAIGAFIGLLFTLTPKVHIAVAPDYEQMQFMTLVELLDDNAALLRTEEIQVSASVTLPTVGAQRIGVTRATGVVVLLNSGEMEHVLPADSEVATQSGILFRTTEQVIVPGREVSYFLDVPVGVNVGRAEVRVIAVEPGSDGNVAAERIRVLHGEWPDLTIRNLDPTTGGTDTMVQAVSTTDIENVSAHIAQSLSREAEAKIGELAKQSEGRHVIETEWTERSDVQFSHSVGEVTNEVRGYSEGTLKLSWIDVADFSHFVERTIPERVPIGYTWERTMGFHIFVEGYDGDQRVLRLRADVPLRPTIDRVELAQSVAGQSVSEAIAQLHSQHGIASAVIRPERTVRLPTWAPWIRIYVEEEDDRP